VRPSSIESVAQ